MPKTRGYLDGLVQSALPAGASITGARSSHLPEWGPTPVGTVPDEASPARVPAPTPHTAAAAPDSTTGTARFTPITEIRQATDAAPRPASQPTVTRHPIDLFPTAAPVVPTTAQRPPSAARADVTRGGEPTGETTPAAVAARAEAARIVSPPTIEAKPQGTARTQPTRLPPGTETAVARIEHLSRRFTAALAANWSAPVTSPRDADETQSAPRADRAVKARLVALAAPPVVSARPAASPRVEIGSIEVFVTSPPASAPAPASVAPSMAPTRPLGRLSQPPHPYGFGQR